MRRSPGPTDLLAAFLLLVTSTFPAPAQEDSAGASRPVIPASSFDAQADHFQAETADRFVMEGNVSFQAEGILLQADRVTYDRVTRTGEAVGNVLYVQGTGRLAGERVTFDVGAGTAEIFNATGYLAQGFLFRARKVIQIDDDHLRFEKGIFTACTQPVPYWSFKASGGLVIRDRYVHLYNLRPRVGAVQFFYFPWLVFPIKPDRATGMLMPQIGFYRRLGTSLNNAFFWDIRRNMDATFYLDLFTSGSVGAGLEHRFIPNARGAGVLNGHFVREQNLDPEFQPDRDRWNVLYDQRQDFQHGGRFNANFNLVSDGNYYLDFSLDPDRGQNPTAFSRAEYILNKGYTSFNMRVERREQFFAFNDVIQNRLPEVELFMRSRRLGKSPLYFAMEGSADVLDKTAPGFPTGAYGRIDVFPTLSAPWSPLPYLDLTPTLRLRETYYTQALDPNQPDQFGDSLSREFLQFDLLMLGPRFTRIFEDKEGGSRLKSTIEPRIVYRYQTSPDSQDNLRVPNFDEIDILPRDLNQFNYGFTSRLFARRQVRAPSSRSPAEQTEAYLRDAQRREAASVGGYAGELEGGLPMVGGLPGENVEAVDSFSTQLPAPLEDTVLTSPVEIASITIFQRYSLDMPLSIDQEFQDTDGDGLLDTAVVVGESQFSPVILTGRYNPSAAVNLVTNVGYDILEQTISSTSVSAGLFAPKKGYLNGTWFYQNDLSGLNFSSSQLRVAGGTRFLRRKVSMAVSFNYNASLSLLQDQRYRVGYDTQCCGFAVDYLRRDFVGTEDRSLRFTVNLRGIGSFGSGQ